MVSRRWRDAVGDPPPPSDGQDLPALPGDDDDRPSGKRLGKVAAVFGLLLFIAIAALLASSLLPFGQRETTPTPTVPGPATVAQTVPTVAEPTQAPQPTVVSDYLVCIDPGHGGYDMGYQRLPYPTTNDDTIYTAPFLTESELNLSMALMLRDELESRGIGVVMTRDGNAGANPYALDVNGDGRTILDGDTWLQRKQNADRDELQARINICNNAGADILISMHLNGGFPDDQSVSGIEVLYTAERDFQQENIDLANSIFRSVDQAYTTAGFETSRRGVKSDDELQADVHGLGPQGHLIMTGPRVENPDYTIEPSNMPGIYVEPLFLSNDDDATWIADTGNQRILVLAYADGIQAYFEQHP